MKIEIEKEDLEKIVTALAFSSGVDTCWDNELNDLKMFAELSVNLCKKYNVKPSKDLYIFEQKYFEHEHIVDILKSVLEKR